MKTLKEALFSRKNISKIKDINEIIKYGGCILIHDYEIDEEIIIYNTYDCEMLEIFRSSRFNSWDVINNYIDKSDLNEYISNKCDLYTIEGYMDESQWPKLRSIFFEALGEPLFFKPIENIIRAIKKYNMELCPLTT